NRGLFYPQPPVHCGDAEPMNESKVQSPKSNVSRPGRPRRRLWTLDLGLWTLLLLLLASTALPARAVQPFLVGFPSFVTSDAGVDSQGFTYLLAENGAIKKIDQSGLEIGGTNWVGDVSRVQTIPFFFFSFT